MKTRLTLLSAFVLLAVGSASAAMRYVDANSASPSPPYTNWTTAARVIQDTVDAALPGDEIVVTNGTYATGGRAVGTNVLVNRVAVDKPLTLRSVNGPQFTIIQGEQVPGTTNGIRCVYLTSDTSLSGFTLTNGAADLGGGVWCAFTHTVVSNCVIAGNQASQGGGVYGGTLYNCTLAGNSAIGYYGNGGGASSAALYNCTLTGNSASSTGGGAWSGTLNNCLVVGNSADFGGGASSWLTNCTVVGNRARVEGGGVDGDIGSPMFNSIVYFNTAPAFPNYCGYFPSYCCTTPLPGPWMAAYGAVGNFAQDPQLASASHLSAGSPCRGAGSAAYSTGTDIDGEPWGNPPSIGCDEYHSETLTGPLNVAISAEYTNVAAGFQAHLTATIEGRATASVWDFGDGKVALNEPYILHAWMNPGDYTVAVWAFNESHPEGVGAAVTIHVVAQPVYYVAAASPNPLPPYTSWATAATNIQNAVDAALPGALVLVTNGAYATGGRPVGTSLLANRVAADKPLTLRSVNGPQFTVIQGYQVPGETNGDGAIRCVYLADGASLSGFTLTNGATRTGWNYHVDYVEQCGGGVWCESTTSFVSNCVIAGNSAYDYGGGAYDGTLNNCTLTGNSAGAGGAGGGGGAYGATLNNCTLTGNSAGGGGGAFLSTLDNCMLTGNSADYGGGARGCGLNNCTLTGNWADSRGGGASAGILNNCIVYYNTAPNGPNYYQEWNGWLNFCCTSPMPTNGVGNVTNAPLFVDYTGGNLRLQSNSPCINAGLNAYTTGSTDLDGNPRIVSGTVDIGAYEYQGAGSVISYAWLQQFGLPTDGSADAKDADGDGHNNWQEWRCQTDPTNALSVLRLLSTSSDGTNVTVTWQSIAGVSYFLERSAGLSGTPPFTPLITNLPGQSGTTRFTDTNAANLAPLCYRVGVGQ